MVKRTFAGSSEEKNEPANARLPQQSSTTIKKAVCVASQTYPSYGTPIDDLDTICALNLCYNFQRTDLLDSLHHSPFTTYTTVSYMLSNTHMVDRFLTKKRLRLTIFFLMCVKFSRYRTRSFLGQSPIGKLIFRKSPSQIDDLVSLDDILWMEQFFDHIRWKDHHFPSQPYTSQFPKSTSPNGLMVWFGSNPPSHKILLDKICTHKSKNMKSLTFQFFSARLNDQLRL